MSEIAENVYFFLGHSRFLHAFSLVVFATIIGTHFLRSIFGTAGLFSIISVEILLAILILFARRRTFEWRYLLPSWIVIFLMWIALSYTWSYYPVTTILGVSSQISFTFLAYAVVAIRDNIQIVRALGDVFRASLFLSLSLEVLSGIIFDIPFSFLGIQGNITNMSGIQGIFGSRNLLSFVIFISFITFAIELLTKSVSKRTSFVSLGTGAILLVFVGSPLVYLSLLLMGIVISAIFWVRGLEKGFRRKKLITLGVVFASFAAVFWIFRTQFLTFVQAAPAFNFRAELWSEIVRISSMKSLEGWGWAGLWPRKTQPFSAMQNVTGQTYSSGLNAFLDLWLQVGVVGLIIFLIAFSIFAWRTISTAMKTKSHIFLWPVFVFVVLAINSLTQSFLISEFGWFLFVLCSVLLLKSRNLINDRN
jgi:O-antigen ligase